MQAAAQKYGEDPNLWGIVGLLHDFDYEMSPRQHPSPASPSSKSGAWPSRSPTRSSATPTSPATRARCPRQDDLRRGRAHRLRHRRALVQPDKRLTMSKSSSVRKKLKDKAFARSVIREDIWKGMEELGADFEDHVQFVVDALKPVAHRDRPEPIGTSEELTHGGRGHGGEESEGLPSALPPCLCASVGATPATSIPVGVGRAGRAARHRAC